MKFSIDKSPKKISRMFSDVAPKYDFMNDLMTGFLHRITRKYALKLTHFTSGKIGLDLATGTGDFAFLLQSYGGDHSKVIGCDFSSGMLQIAQRKAKRKPKFKCNETVFIESDMNNLPFRSNKFDVCTMSFGIRNVQKPESALIEIKKVTKNGGRLIIIESSLPSNRFLWILVTLYFKNIVPALARVISRNPSSYSYYFDSLQTFVSPQQFLALMKKTGWKRTQKYPLIFGTVMVYLGIK
ncbi:MAG: ubiquinone/menaquinone biosynthesis methyltransferase [Candidatus Hodarchaeales archaeon]|jgi:demethylmenaquinone methyltransferase/2-methoxy-6-polyprenyl-1,4-benzoquinol methylase